MRKPVHEHACHGTDAAGELLAGLDLVQVHGGPPADRSAREISTTRGYTGRTGLAW